jgi:16S rRNA U1498 N3-methylase RsmE
MRIDDLTELSDYLESLPATHCGAGVPPALAAQQPARAAETAAPQCCVWLLSTAPDSIPALTAAQRLLETPSTSLHLLIGPEGGWTDAEIAAIRTAGALPVSLGPTVLRIETAAVAAAVIASGIAQCVAAIAHRGKKS